jgi:hypothetical protein
MNAPVLQIEVLPDGFRRTGPVAEPVRWTAIRARLSNAVAGQSRALREGLSVFRSWQDAGASVATLLPPGALRDTAASRRALQRSLRTLATEPTSIAELAARALGAPVRVRGRILRARWRLPSHIWSKGEISRHNVRLLIEEGHDFFLADATGQVALVLASGGYLVGDPAPHVDVGDQVEVFGFLDQVIDRDLGSRARDLRAEPVALALRSGAEQPLILRKVATPAAERTG